MHIHAVTRVHAVTPKLVICVMYLTSIWRILLMTDGLNAVWSNDRAAHTDTNPKNLELAPPQSITATRLDQFNIAIKQLSCFSITYYVIYYSFSSHPIIIMQILFNYTFTIVSTTNCNSKIYDLFVKLINHFKIYSLTTLIFIFYPSLNLTRFYSVLFALVFYVYLSFLAGYFLDCNPIYFRIELS